MFDVTVQCLRVVAGLWSPKVAQSHVTSLDFVFDFAFGKGKIRLSSIEINMTWTWGFLDKRYEFQLCTQI